MGRAGPGPVNYGFDRAGPGLGLEYMGPGWSGPRVGEPVANTALHVELGMGTSATCAGHLSRRGTLSP